MKSYVLSSLSTFISSVLAGCMIGLGGVAYLSSDSKLVGSILFSFGLMTIVSSKLSLYTGKIGFISKIRQVPIMLNILLGNFVGTFSIATLCKTCNMSISSDNLCVLKLSESTTEAFILAFLCGVMMYLAVDQYSKTKETIYLIFPVSIFIVCGFEHSVANSFYFFLNPAWDSKMWFNLVVYVLGNTAGSISVRILEALSAYLMIQSNK